MDIDDYSLIGEKVRRNNKVVGMVEFDDARKGWTWRRPGFSFGAGLYLEKNDAFFACASDHENDLNNVLQMKRVWILGSGFSKGGGGPLLNELLTPSSREKLKAQFDFGSNFETVYDIYWLHHSKREKDPATARIPIFWDDAEQFLTFMDSVKRDHGGYRAKMFAGQHPDVNVDDFYRKCVQAVAAECCFTEKDLDLEGEDWQPYVDWAKTLTPHDTIITFNYDMVLEHLASETGSGLQRGSFIEPQDWRLAGKAKDKRAVFNLTRVYKLHGSVNWIDFEYEGQKRSGIMAPLTLLGRGGQPFIATPGPSKKLHANGFLGAIWDGALQAIAEADTIVFVGYRFPPSDSEARRKLLTAIGTEEQPNIKVHIVLGPRTAEDDSVRLRALLESTLRANRSPVGGSKASKRKFDVQTHPLYTQDFLSVLHPGMLDESNVAMFDENEVIRMPR